MTSTVEDLLSTSSVSQQQADTLKKIRNQFPLRHAFDKRVPSEVIQVAWIGGIDHLNVVLAAVCSGGSIVLVHAVAQKTYITDYPESTVKPKEDKGRDKDRKDKDKKQDSKESKAAQHDDETLRKMELCALAVFSIPKPVSAPHALPAATGASRGATVVKGRNVTTAPAVPTQSSSGRVVMCSIADNHINTFVVTDVHNAKDRRAEDICKLSEVPPGKWTKAFLAFNSAGDRILAVLRAPGASPEEPPVACFAVFQRNIADKAESAFSIQIPWCNDCPGNIIAAQWVERNVVCMVGRSGVLTAMVVPPNEAKIAAVKTVRLTESAQVTNAVMSLPPETSISQNPTPTAQLFDTVSDATALLHVAFDGAMIHSYRVDLVLSRKRERDGIIPSAHVASLNATPIGAYCSPEFKVHHLSPCTMFGAPVLYAILETGCILVLDGVHLAVISVEKFVRKKFGSRLIVAAKDQRSEGQLHLCVVEEEMVYYMKSLPSKK